MSTPDLSLIFPVLNESAKIAADILSAAAYCQGAGLRTEIIISDDGSTDDGLEIARRTAKQLPAGVSLIVLENRGHRGKGYAVRRGILEARGAIIMFADSGGNVTWKYLSVGMDLIQSGSCQIAHGSRKLPGSKILVQQSPLRRLISNLFGRLIPRILSLPGRLTDTQCGFKLYSNQAAKVLYRQSMLDRFLFDLEIIMRAQRAGFALSEFPLEWSCDSDSRFNLFAELPGIMKEFSHLLNIARSNRAV